MLEVGDEWGDVILDFTQYSADYRATGGGEKKGAYNECITVEN